MNGPNCPQCGRPTDWGSTTNEWQYLCKPCDTRWNRAGQPMPPFETIGRLGANEPTYERPYTDVRAVKSLTPGPSEAQNPASEPDGSR